MFSCAFTGSFAYSLSEHLTSFKSSVHFSGCELWCVLRFHGIFLSNFSPFKVLTTLLYNGRRLNMHAAVMPMATPNSLEIAEIGSRCNTKGCRFLTLLRS